MSISEFIGVKPAELSSATEKIATTGPDDSWPPVEIVKGSRECRCKSTHHEHAHHGGSQAVGENRRDLTHNSTALDRAWIHPYCCQEHEDACESKRDYMPHPEVPRSNLEPTLAVLDGIGRKSRSIHREVIHIWSKRIETVCKPHIFELISNLTHPFLLRLTPLRSLKRNVDSRRQ